MGAIQKELKWIQDLTKHTNEITKFTLSSDVRLTWINGNIEEYGTVNVSSPSAKHNTIPNPIISYMTEVVCDKYYEGKDTHYTPKQIKERLQMFHDITGIREIFDVSDIANIIRLRDVECYDYIEVIIHMDYRNTYNISINFNIYMDDGYSYDIDPDNLLSITIYNEPGDKSLRVSDVFLDTNYLFKPINFDTTISTAGFYKPIERMIKEYFQKLLDEE